MYWKRCVRWLKDPIHTDRNRKQKRIIFAVNWFVWRCRLLFGFTLCERALRTQSMWYMWRLIFKLCELLMLVQSMMKMFKIRSWTLVTHGERRQYRELYTLSSCKLFRQCRNPNRKLPQCVTEWHGEILKNKTYRSVAKIMSGPHRLHTSHMFKPCSHRTSALTLALICLDRSRTHLHFDASVNTDVDAFLWTVQLKPVYSFQAWMQTLCVNTTLHCHSVVGVHVWQVCPTTWNCVLYSSEKRSPFLSGHLAFAAEIYTQVDRNKRGIIVYE